MFSFLIPYVFLKLTSYKVPPMTPNVVDKEIDNMSHEAGSLNTLQDRYNMNEKTHGEEE